VQQATRGIREPSSLAAIYDVSGTRRHKLQSEKRHVKLSVDVHTDLRLAMAARNKTYGCPDFTTFIRANSSESTLDNLPKTCGNRIIPHNERTSEKSRGILIEVSAARVCTYYLSNSLTTFSVDEDRRAESRRSTVGSPGNEDGPSINPGGRHRQEFEAMKTPVHPQ
jgi:hypothetical protein